MQHHAVHNEHNWNQDMVQVAVDYVNIEQPIADLQSLLQSQQNPTIATSQATTLHDLRAALAAKNAPADTLHDLVEKTCKRSFVRPCSDAAFEELHNKIMHSSLPNEDQRTIVAAVFGNNATKCMRISGGGGNGKTALLQYIVHRFARQGKMVIATATTAKAADRLGLPGATTVHRAFGIGRSGFTPCNNAALQAYIDLSDVIVLDESSMASADLLMSVNDRCHECSDDVSTELFAGKVVILVGDPHQLPAVCTRRQCQNIDPALCLHQPYRCTFWSSMPEFELYLSKRHAGDTAYGECLAHMRKHDLDDANLAYLTNHVTINTQTEAHNTRFPQHAKVLAATNDLVRSYIRKQLLAHHGADNVVSLAADHMFKRCTGLTTRDEEAAIARMQYRSDLPAKLDLAVGCPVTITRNILPSKRLFNGTPAIVTSISKDVVTIKVSHLPKDVAIRRRTDTYFLPGGGQLQRRMFPLQCSYAQTVHDVQGDTINTPLVIDLSHFKGRPALAYVAFSRATCAANVTVILPAGATALASDMFCPHRPAC